MAGEGALRVALRPAYSPGAPEESSGVQNYVQGLAAGLSGLEGDDVYEFVGTRQQYEALAPFVSGATSFLTLPDVPWLSASTGSGLRSTRLVVRVLETPPGRAARSLRRRARAARPVPRVRAAPLWPSPEVIEGGAYSVVHYAAPAGELTRHPTIYQPWDLQHIHFPEFFTREHLLGRERWRVCSERATYVLVASKFVRDDVIAAYDVDPGRVAVVAPGVPTALHAAPPHPGPSDIPFALYPAQPWKHKNHIRLVDAIALFRDRRVDVRLVCPGPPNPNQSEVRRRVDELGLGSFVQFPGFVSDAELAGLFQQGALPRFPISLRRVRVPCSRGVHRRAAGDVLLDHVTARAHGRRRRPLRSDRRRGNGGRHRAGLDRRGAEDAARRARPRARGGVLVGTPRAVVSGLVPRRGRRVARSRRRRPPEGRRRLCVKLTLVTPTLNAATYLPEALASVRSQQWHDLEHIVVDGGSTDATLDILRAEPNLIVVSEPDGGLYDAINKGIAMATGEIVGFLNADDLLTPGALAAVARGYDATPGAEMIAGGAEVFESTASGTATTVKVNDRGAKLLREQDVVHGAPIFNARFFTPSFLERVGPLDTRWRWSADAEWLMRCPRARPWSCCRRSGRVPVACPLRIAHVPGRHRDRAHRGAKRSRAREDR